MNYTVIGQDGKHYGPIGAEQIRQWIKQLRLENRTPVFMEGAVNWTFLGLLPEFASEFLVAPPVVTPPPFQAAAPSGTNPLALWGFICGLLSWSFCGCCLPVALVGLTLSIIALVQLNSRAAQSAGRGYAIAGLVLSAANILWSMGLTLLGLFNDSSQMQWHLGNLN